MLDCPEVIWRYINYVGCDDGILLVAIAEMRFIMVYPKTVRTDLECFGYHIDEDELLSSFTGSCAYYEVSVAERHDCLSIIFARCQEHKNIHGKIFSPSEAKVGVPLPPFSKQCRCDVMLVRKKGTT